LGARHCRVRVCKEADRGDQADPFFAFGSIDRATGNVRASGRPIKYAPTYSSHGFWLFGSTPADVNGGIVHLPGHTLNADTGTAFVIVSVELWKAIFDATLCHEHGNPCQINISPAKKSANAIPKVNIAVGDHQFTIYVNPGSADDGNETGCGGVQLHCGVELNILGDTFWKFWKDICLQRSLGCGLLRTAVPPDHFADLR
jgi:Eukaryotic aspartyl protease